MRHARQQQDYDARSEQCSYWLHGINALIACVLVHDAVTLPLLCALIVSAAPDG